MDSRPATSRLVALTATAGYLLALLGAVDPLEGSVAVALGCGLVALHAWLTPVPQALRTYRVAVAVMAGLGVAALWVVSELGGFGGEEGVAGAWALLILPYPAALVALFSGPAAPRWVAWGGCAVGVGYVAIAAVIVLRPPPHGGNPIDAAALVGSLGLALLAACAARIAWQRQRQRGPKA
ncbi:MAG: hypothetical protein RI988_406 [Pseudomonadota bacterium]|jgi:hypothetical protein